MENFEKDYRITGTYASLLSLVGWLVMLGGIFSLGIYIYITFTGLTPQYLKDFGINYLYGEFLIGGVAAIAIGLLVIITGQILRAIVDNTNANKETLLVLKAIKNSPVMNKKEDKTSTKSSTKSSTKGSYVRDGIKFKSKEDLEAYFDAQK